MQAEDRPIHFSTELLFPPFQLNTPVMQRIYYELSQHPLTAYDSADFNQAGPPRLVTARGKTQSVLLFLPDRLVVIEEWVDITLGQFIEKTRTIMATVFASCELENVIAQTVTLRTTFALTHFQDARVFLLDHVCGQEGSIWPHFQRPVGVGGIRFILPRTAEHPGDLHVIIESFIQSPNEVFVEVKGIFGELQVNEASVETLGANARHVRSFITQSVYPYLQQYDHPQEEPE